MKLYRLTQSNNLLGRSSGTRQVYLNDLTDKILPWTQEKFENVRVLYSFLERS